MGESCLPLIEVSSPSLAVIPTASGLGSLTQSSAKHELPLQSRIASLAYMGATVPSEDPTGKVEVDLKHDICTSARKRPEAW